MTVEIVVFSSEVSRDMDLETAVLMSWLNLLRQEDSSQAIKLTSSER